MNKYGYQVDAGKEAEKYSGITEDQKKRFRERLNLLMTDYKDKVTDEIILRFGQELLGKRCRVNSWCGAGQNSPNLNWCVIYEVPTGIPLDGGSFIRISIMKNWYSVVKAYPVP